MRKIDFGSVLLQKPVNQNDFNMTAKMNESKKNHSPMNFKDMMNNIKHHKITSKSNEKTIEDFFDQCNDESVVFINSNDGEQITIVDAEVNFSLEDLQQLLVLDEKPSILPLENNHASELGVADAEPIEETNHIEENNQLIVNEMEEQLNQFIAELNLLFERPNDIDNIMKSSKDLHRLFQMWDKLPKEMKELIKESNAFSLNESEEAVTVLKELFTIFEKRSSFTKQQMYQVDASITVEDVRKWLQQALERHSLLDGRQQDIQVTSNQPLQMSNIEQYTIHTTDLERIDAISRNLVADVNKVINRSNFLKQPGLEQLTFTLRPASLGEVTIRLVQVNGEMTVKFFVATQAARELFEANIHQLKPMFAPHQIAIERDAAVSDEDFYQKEQEQFEEEHDEQKENNHERRNNETKETDVPFDELLHVISKEAIV